MRGGYPQARIAAALAFAQRAAFAPHRRAGARGLSARCADGAPEPRPPGPGSRGLSSYRPELVVGVELDEDAGFWEVKMASWSVADSVLLEVPPVFSVSPLMSVRRGNA